MKKFILALSILFLAVACFDSTEEDTTQIDLVNEVKPEISLAETGTSDLSYCEQIEEAGVEVGEDSRYVTPQEAFDALAEDNYISGVPIVEVENENVVRWSLQDEGSQIGLVEVNRFSDNGFWQVVQAKWCADVLSSSSDSNLLSRHLIDRPLDCLYIEETEFDIVEGTGYDTSEQAFASLASMGLSNEPSVVIHSGESGANYKTLVFLENGQKIAEATVAQAAWELWVITSVQQCVAK